MSCSGLIGLIAVILFFVWLTDNPGVLLAFLIVAAIVGLIMWWRNRLATDNRVREGFAMGRRIEALATNFAQLDDIALSLKPEEKAFYQIDGVQLREYRSGGSTYKGGYAGGNLNLTKGFSISAGGNKGKIVRNEEQVTTLDVGTAIFTTQRVIFAGPNHTREWEFSKLLNIDVEENGFVVSISSSNSQRTAALAGPMELGITPGVLFSIALEVYKEGEEAGKAFALKTAKQFQSEAESYFAEKGKSVWG
jgi:hypothetical protein